MEMELLQNTCNMCNHDLPDMYFRTPWPVTPGLQAYLSVKSLMPMLQLLHT